MEMADSSGGSKGKGTGGGSSSVPVPVPRSTKNVTADDDGSSSLAPSTVPAARARSTTALLAPAFDGMSDASPHHSPLRPPAAMEERGINADSSTAPAFPSSSLNPLKTTTTTARGNSDAAAPAAAPALPSPSSADLAPAPGSSVPKGEGVSAAAKAGQAAGGGVKRVKSVRRRRVGSYWFLSFSFLSFFFLNFDPCQKKLFSKKEPRLGGDQSGLPVIRIGVCAMDKKARSKPMQEIVARLQASGEFEVSPFGDDVILNKPIEEWPRCDCLLSWHSDGFPLTKAQAYADLRRPYLINDVHMQDLLLDRREVYAKLQASGIPVPRHVVVDREGLPRPPPGLMAQCSSSVPSPAASSALEVSEGDEEEEGEEADSSASPAAPDARKKGGGRSGAGGPEPAGGGESEGETDTAPRIPDFSPYDPPGFVETEDAVELHGVRIRKPFVEKPSNAEDHNIYIYYPHSMGGGVKRLFRKVHDKSGDYDPHHPGHVRRDGAFSFIYGYFLRF